MAAKQERTLWLHSQDVCCILLRQLSHSQVVVLLQHVDGLVAPGQEVGECKVRCLGVGHSRCSQEQGAVLLGRPAV